MSAADGLGGAVARLRAAFDASFAAPSPEQGTPRHEVVAVTIASRGFALRRAEIAGIAVDRRVVPLPGAERSLLGVTSLRGVVMPVFSLGELLGFEPDGRPERWVAWVGGERPACFTFGTLEGLLRVTAEQLRFELGVTPLVRGAVVTEAGRWPLIDLSRAARAGFGRQSVAREGA